MSGKGLQEKEEMRLAGFSDQEISDWEGKERSEMLGAGFSTQEADDYFGTKRPSKDPIKNMVKENLALYQPKEADGILEALDAGWQTSVSGLISRGERPDTILPEDAGTAARIASQVAQIAGDLPAMIAGTMAGAAGGGAVGSAVPVVGTVIGAGVGGGAVGNALPAGMRKAMMEYYERGEVADFQSFWEIASAASLEALKEGVIGGVSFGVGGKVGGMVAKTAAPAFVKGGASAASEVATMVTLGRAYEGEAPKLSDFTDAAILIGGMHGAAKVGAKLKHLYVAKGINPTQAVEMMKESATAKQEFLSDGIDLPSMFKEGAELLANEDGKIEIPVKPEPVPPKPLSVAESDILADVGVKEKADNGARIDADVLAQNLLDKYDPIKRSEDFLQKDLAPDQSPYLAFRMANDYKSKTKHFVEYGTIDYASRDRVGKSLKEIVEPFSGAGELESFKAYLISKRALELTDRGIESGFNVESAKQVVNEGAGKYDAAAKDLVEFQNAATKYLKDSGILSEESYQNITKANQAYIPYHRITEILDGQDGSGQTAKKGKSLKNIKGSDKKIQDPFISIVENLETHIKSAEINRAKRLWIESFEKSPDQTLMKKVVEPRKPIELHEGEIAKLLKEHGVEDVEPGTFSIFRSAKRSLAPNEIEIYRNGKREVFEIQDPLIVEAFHQLDGDPVTMNAVMKFAQAITKVKKIGITMTPDFVIRNYMRDFVTAGIFSKESSFNIAKSAAESISAMGDIVLKKDVYADFLRSGGGGAAFLDIDTNYIKEVFNVHQETGFLDKTWNIIKTPKDLLELGAHITEQATRLAEFKRVAKGATSGSKLVEAGMAAREITVDFSKMGAKMSAFNSISSFSNVAIQGLNRTARAFKEDWKGSSLKAATAITLPSVLLWWANKDDERYREIPRWQKDVFWIIPTDKWEETDASSAMQQPEHMRRQNAEGKWEINNGVIWRIPKPMELGIIFGSVPERILEAIDGRDPNAFKDLGDTFAGLIPNFLPDAGVAAIEHATNKSFFTGRPLLGYGMERNTSELQYTEYTSESAKQIGKLIGAIPGLRDVGPDNFKLDSPIAVEHYIRSITGTLGTYALQLAEKALVEAGVTPDPVRPASTLADIPFVKSFVIRHPSATAQSIQDFQSAFRENEKFWADISTLKKNQEFDQVAEKLADPENREKFVRMKGIDNSLTKLNQLIRAVYKDPNKTPEDKRQLIDSTYAQMIEIAKVGNLTLREAREELKEE